jgi:hypothetical protein
VKRFLSGTLVVLICLAAALVTLKAYDYYLISTLPAPLACIACVVGTFVAALPLRRFDLWWVPTINRISASVLVYARSRYDRLRKA